MRAVALFGMSILIVALVFIAPPITTGQPGGKTGGKFGGIGGKGGGFSRDPGQMFDMMTGGKSTSLPIDKLFYGQDFAKQFAKEKGITNGHFTKDQYIQFSTAYSEYRKASRGGGKGGMPGPGGPTGPGGFPFKMKGGGASQGGADTAPPPVQVNPDLIKQLADESFKRLDADKDGKLNQDEMPGRLRKQLSQWDKNMDGFIDRHEYRDYFAAQLGGGVPGDDPGTRNLPSVIQNDEELDKKPVVFRAGKLPSGLPPWFKELDKDPVDGQVALNEWRAAGKDLEEFKTWDLNDDGFITIDEALKVNLSAAKSNGAAAAGAPGDKGARPAFGGFKIKNGKGKKGPGG